MNSADKLWELKKLEYKRDVINEDIVDLVSRGKYLSSSVSGLGIMSGALDKINSQIAELLKDET